MRKRSRYAGKIERQRRVDSRHDQPDGNLPNRYVRIGSESYIWQMESPASVDAGQLGATAFYINTPGLNVKPGEEYEVMFMPWVNLNV